MNYSSFTPLQKKLLKVVAFSTFGFTAMCVGAQFVTSNRYINMPYTQKALDLLKKYPATSEKYIGTEINPGRIPILLGRNPFTKINPNDTRLSLKVYGDKGMGSLFIWARRKYIYDDFYQKDEWLIRRLDIEICDGGNYRRWKFYENEPVPEIETQTNQVTSSSTSTPIKDVEINENDPMIWVKAKIK